MLWTPSNLTARARLATLGFGLLFVCLQGFQIDSSSDNGGVAALSVTALVTVMAILLITGLLQRQLSIWEGPATAALATLVGIGLTSPFGVLTTCIGIVIAQSLYGSGKSELLRIVSLLPVIPASLALSAAPVAERLPWYSPASLSLLSPIVLIAGILHLIKSALASQEEAEQRARFTSDLTGDLLASDTLEQSSRIIISATEEMCRLSPGVVIVGCHLRVADRRPPTVTVNGVYGAELVDPPTAIPADVVAELPRLDRENPDATSNAQRRLIALGLPGGRTWYAHGGDDLIDGSVANLGLFGVPKSLSERVFGRPSAGMAELLAALRALSEHRRTAFTYLQEKRDLMAAANRDDITGLTKRSPFLEQLDELMAAEPGRVALIVVGLDGLHRIALRNGLASASMAASRLARLTLGVVGERGAVGRLSDARFAVAVPAADSQQVEHLMQSLRRALSEPVQLGGQTLALSISTGVARAEATTSCWELVERAILALRLDREASPEPMVRPA